MPQGLRVDLLGETLLTRNSKIIRAGGPRRASIMALLALRAPLSVSRLEFAAALWGEDPRSRRSTHCTCIYRHCAAGLDEVPSRPPERVTGSAKGLPLTSRSSATPWRAVPISWPGVMRKSPRRLFDTPWASGADLRWLTWVMRPWADSVRLDVYYVENWSFFGDLLILAKTLRAVVRGQGAY